MVENTLIVISGATGYIGSNLLSYLDKLKYETILIGSNKKIINNKFTQYLPSDITKLIHHSKKNIYFFHLATFYSKKGSDKTKIEEANINFGVEILEKLRQNNLRKIIYTNTMFKFQEENKDYFYTRTKNKFTDLIKSELKLGEILSELYLDNTFGPNDTRNKIFNQIKTCIINEQISPVANKEAFINLSYIDDVIHCLATEISPNFGESRLTSNRDYSTQSIFDFLKHFHSKQKVDSSILISAETKYKNLINLPDVNSNFKESDFVNNLINTFNS